MSRPVVAALFTGGTISMRVDAVEGGAVPSLGADEILAAARGVEEIADVRAEQWGRFPGPHMTVERQWALRARILEVLADPAVAGVVLTHGTDTLEETAYLVARSVESDKPVVFTGAMRAASDLGYDGPQNLIDAVRVAADPAARGVGTMVVMGGRIFAGLEDTKSHTHQLDAFEAPGLGPIGVVDDDRVIFRRRVVGTPPVLKPDAPATPVDIVATWAGSDARLLDASLASGARGVVVAAMGRGNVPPEVVPGIERWIASGRPVVIASRAGRGMVGRTYAYPGGGRKLSELGALFAGARRPAQARIDLMLGLGAGLDAAGLRALFDG
ncbi:asparaginase [Roseisolibacter sp. H3M3-2]|uniref:asparaginase n=1 Tax=Roseisolibacter sp. H3M3-2 TaxID=3031323 RepID=UPI0023D97E92|nr:asparaginase [Roseisolibacter sp. H3M3-2]MDF1503045.1 asparaginase [Roseisolibacter sp. H3M3-2]